MTSPTLSSRLLSWYDRNARQLPWRIPPGQPDLPDPYHIWLSEIMLQQTTVVAVIPYFQKFLRQWPDIHALAAARDADVMAAWAGLGYYARARNLLKCARVLSREQDGQFPQTSSELQNLPGIGPYTAAAISAIAFQRPETVVDGNVERVMARLHAHTQPLPTAKPALTTYAAALTPKRRPGDYAQALMDLGATICTPKSPSCGQCPWRPDCRAHARGIAASLPAKSPKQAKPIRYGIVYIGRTTGGDWLLERRPEKGLLGGMLGFPGTGWLESAPPPNPPLRADWRTLPGEVRHTFTHFHLRLAVEIAEIPMIVPAPLFLCAAPDFRPGDLPTLMRKAYDLAAQAPDATLHDAQSAI